MRNEIKKYGIKKGDVVKLSKQFLEDINKNEHDVFEKKGIDSDKIINGYF